MAEHPRRVAVIDIGTNTLLLLVAEQVLREGRASLTARYDACRFGRLGQGLEHSGALHPEAIARSLDIMREYRAVIEDHEVDVVAAIGTQALREASNAAEFVGPAGQILGAPIEVIAGEREAALVHRAVVESFPELTARSFVVADVGGGSTEIIVSATGAGTSKVESFTSLNIGSVRLFERHLHDDPPTADQVRALFEDIDRALARLDLPTGVCLVGTAGTATSIASVELELRAYDADRVHGMSLPRDVVERQLAHLLELTIARRKVLPGLEPQRADVIAAGVAIYVRLLHRLDADQLLISDRGVRWGLAHELAAAG